MKKLILTICIAILGVATANAQSSLPKGCNSNVIDASITAQAAQGWDVSTVNYQPINYLVQPEAPYLTGTVTVTYVPHCEPYEVCIQIIKAEFYDVTIMNDQGTCVVTKQ